MGVVGPMKDRFRCAREPRMPDSGENRWTYEPTLSRPTPVLWGHVREAIGGGGRIPCETTAASLPPPIAGNTAKPLPVGNRTDRSKSD